MNANQNLFRKYRAGVLANLTPWAGGDPLDPMPSLVEAHESDMIDLPSRTSLYPTKGFVDVRGGIHSFCVRQTGSKSPTGEDAARGCKNTRYGSIGFTDSHGWHGRKTRRTFKDGKYVW